MKGYVATTRLTNMAGDVLAEKDGPCDKVPDASMVWLIAQKLVVPEEAKRGEV